MNHLDGAADLAYSRIRNDQTEQDTGHQARQHRVIQTITDKALTRGTLWSPQELLQTFAAKMETNLQTSDYLDFQRYGYTAMVKNIKQEAFGASTACGKKGLTGIWQVSGRSDIKDFEEVVALDKEYICTFSLGLYLKIFFKTIMVVLGRKGSV